MNYGRVLKYTLRNTYITLYASPLCDTTQRLIQRTMSFTPSPSDAARGRCRKCDYPLRGLIENRCPECGRPFDPGDPKTMRFGRRGERVQRWLIKPLGYLTSVLALAATGGVLALTRWPAVPSSMPGFRSSISSIAVCFHHGRGIGASLRLTTCSRPASRCGS